MPATREILRLRVDAEFAEVTLDAFPAAPRRDAHLLVVVARRAAGREGVAEPEAVLRGERVGDVGEGRRALVGRDDEVGIVRVVAHGALQAARSCRRRTLSVRSSRPRMNRR